MKRPEGFDRGRGEAPEVPAPRRGRGGTGAAPGRERATPRRREKPAPTAPTVPRERAAGPAPAPDRERAAGRTPAPERVDERARSRADERARRRAEKRERRRFTSRTRRRRGILVGAVATAVLLVVMLVTAVFSPILALREIEVTGTQQLDPAAIEQAVSGQIGTPLALLDDARITRELGAFDLIRSYTTEIVPPGTLIVRIDERQPLAILPSGGEYLTVDAAGVVLSRSAERAAGMPLVVLDPTTGVDPARAGADPAFQAVVQVLLALPPSVAGQVDRIAARTRDDVAFTITGTDQRVVWGSADDSARKARTLEVLYATYSTAGPGEYDVSGADSAVFREVDLAAEEAAAAATGAGGGDPAGTVPAG